MNIALFFGILLLAQALRPIRVETISGVIDLVLITVGAALLASALS